MLNYKDKFILIAGPCVIESKKQTIDIAAHLKDVLAVYPFLFIFKASYDKANRSSIKSYRGPGLTTGLAVLKEIKEKLKVPILTDVHCQEDIKKVASVADVIQIPAFLCRQTDLILAAARTGKIVNVKKGQFLAPWDVEHIVKKIEAAGNKNIFITERGSSFGYNNLVSDFRSIVIMRRLGYPVIYDATHSVQLPGAGKDSSSGEREFVPHLSRAAVAVGCDGLFLEVHPNPKKALSDAANMISLKDFEALLPQINKINRVVRCQ